jgi:hypothetical protein
VSDDVLYTYVGNRWYSEIHGDLIGLDENRSRVRFRATSPEPYTSNPKDIGIDWSQPTVDGTIENIEVVYWENGQGVPKITAKSYGHDLNVVNCSGWDEEDCCYQDRLAILTWNDVNIRVDDCDNITANIGTFTDGTMDIYTSTFLQADEPCDMLLFGNTDDIGVHTWFYDGHLYSYDAVIGDPPEMEPADSSLYVQATGSWPNYTYTLYARTDFDGGLIGYNYTIVDMSFDWGTSAGSYPNTFDGNCEGGAFGIWAGIGDVTSVGLGNWVYVRARAVMCDSTSTMTGYRKVKVLQGNSSPPYWISCD